MEAIHLLDDVGTDLIAEPWSLLSKAENWRKLGLQDEAVIVADEAIDAQLSDVFSRLGVPKPISREKAIRALKKEGVRLSPRRLMRLKELRERAGRDEGGGLSMSEVDEAISIAEETISKISEQKESVKDVPVSISSRVKTLCKGDGAHFKFHAGGNAVFTALPFSSSGLTEPHFSYRQDVGQVETEFVTKLLLARAILNYRKKKIPRFIGLTFVVSSMVVCSLFGIVGGSGVLLMLSGRLAFSVVGLGFDFMFLLAAYLFLRMALYVRRETR